PAVTNLTKSREATTTSPGVTLRRTPGPGATGSEFVGTTFGRFVDGWPPTWAWLAPERVNTATATARATTAAAATRAATTFRRRCGGLGGATPRWASS